MLLRSTSKCFNIFNEWTKKKKCRGDFQKNRETTCKVDRHVRFLVVIFSTKKIDDWFSCSGIDDEFIHSFIQTYIQTFI